MRYWIEYKRSTGEVIRQFTGPDRRDMPTPHGGATAVKEISEEDFAINLETEMAVVKEGKIEKIPRPPRQITWDEIISQRNNLLRNSDWTDLPNNNLSEEDREAAQVYRQALRDLPDTVNDPSEIVFPERPFFMVEKKKRPIKKK